MPRSLLKGKLYIFLSSLLPEIGQCNLFGIWVYGMGSSKSTSKPYSIAACSEHITEGFICIEAILMTTKYKCQENEVM